jgi:hypothetical protein
VFLKIINIGRAASIDTNLDVIFKKDDQVIQQRHFQQDVILPLEYAELILPESQFEVLPSVVTHIAVSGTYKDGFGQTITVNQSIDVKGYLDSIKQAQIVAPE